MTILIECLSDAIDVLEQARTTLQQQKQQTELIRAQADTMLIVAFVQGAQWCELHNRHATLWPADRRSAEDEASRLVGCGMLGRPFEERVRLARSRAGPDVQEEVEL